MEAILIGKGEKERKALLTTRELLILKMMSRGNASKQIAAMLYISTQTINKHLKNSYRKLDAHNKIGALRNTGLM